MPSLQRKVVQNKKRKTSRKTTCCPSGVCVTELEKENATTNKYANITTSQNVRGVVKCKACMKPRCLYSVTAPKHMKPHDSADKKACRKYALDQLDVASHRDLYMCGMQPFDPDHPMYGVIVTRDGITCSATVEPEFYNNPRASEPWRDPALCAYCAGIHGVEGVVDETLLVQYKTVLPLCEVCQAEGALSIVRTKRKNGNATAMQAQKRKRKPQDVANTRRTRR